MNTTITSYGFAAKTATSEDWMAARGDIGKLEATIGHHRVMLHRLTPELDEAIEKLAQALGKVSDAMVSDAVLDQIDHPE